MHNTLKTQTTKIIQPHSHLHVITQLHCITTHPNKIQHN